MLCRHYNPRCKRVHRDSGIPYASRIPVWLAGSGGAALHSIRVRTCIPSRALPSAVCIDGVVVDLAQFGLLSGRCSSGDHSGPAGHHLLVVGHRW